MSDYDTLRNIEDVVDGYDDWAVPPKTTAMLQERISELEDTVRLHWATNDLHSSHGRNEQANRVLEDIAARRGEDWNGADVSYERP